jgi:ferredoxin
LLADSDIREVFMQVTIDYDLCAGYGQCLLAAPDVFDFPEGAEQVVVLNSAPPEADRELVFGAALARTMLKALLTEVYTRIPDISAATTQLRPRQLHQRRQQPAGGLDAREALKHTETTFDETRSASEQADRMASRHLPALRCHASRGQSLDTGEIANRLARRLGQPHCRISHQCG